MLHGNYTFYDKNLYFGATEPKQVQSSQLIDFLKKNFNHKVYYSGGHMAEDSSALLKKFFQQKDSFITQDHSNRAMI